MMFQGLSGRVQPTYVDDPNNGGGGGMIYADAMQQQPQPQPQRRSGGRRAASAGGGGGGVGGGGGRRSSGRRPASSPRSGTRNRLLTIDPFNNPQNYNSNDGGGGGDDVGGGGGVVDPAYHFAPAIGLNLARGQSQQEQQQQPQAQLPDRLGGAGAGGRGSYYRDQAPDLYGGGGGGSSNHLYESPSTVLQPVNRVQLPNALHRGPAAALLGSPREQSRGPSAGATTAIGGSGDTGSQKENNNHSHNNAKQHKQAAAAAHHVVGKSEIEASREIVRLRHALYQAHHRLQALGEPIPRMTEASMPHIKGLPIQPLRREPKVGTHLLFEGYLEVVEGISPENPEESMTTGSLFGGPTWKRRFVVINEGCVTWYKTQEDATVFAGQKGMKGSMMFHHASAFVPAFGSPGAENSKFTPTHPMAIDTQRFRYFGFVRDSGFLVTFRTESPQEWNVWSHAMGRALNPSLYAQTFPSVSGPGDVRPAGLTKEDEEKMQADLQKEMDKLDEQEKKMAEQQNPSTTRAAAADENQKPSAMAEAEKDESVDVASPFKQQAAAAAATTPTASAGADQQQGATPGPPASSPPPPTVAPPPPKAPSRDYSIGTREYHHEIAPVTETSMQHHGAELADAECQTAQQPSELQVVDPVEVENVWAEHVAELHDKYGEHTSKLESELQLARADVARLKSQIQILERAAGGGGGGARGGATPRGGRMRDDFVGNISTRGSGLVGDNEDDFPPPPPSPPTDTQSYSGDDDDDDDHDGRRVPSLPRAEHSSNNNIPDDTLSPITMSRSPTRISSMNRRHPYSGAAAAGGAGVGCHRCLRLEDELVSTEEERDSLIRELARRHEDYQQGISRLCGEVLDNVDAVHLMMQTMQEEKEAAEAELMAVRGGGAGDAEEEDQYRHHHDSDVAMTAAAARLDAGAAAISAAAAAEGISVPTARPKRDELLALKKTTPSAAAAMNTSGVNSSFNNNGGQLPFLSLQLFEEPVGPENDFKMGSIGRESKTTSKVTARAAFDSRICALDSMPHRDICTWTAREAKTGKSICTLRLKLESASLSLLP